MQGEGILQTIAEVSVAFTGFTGVVIAFGRGTQEVWSPLDLFRFRTMLGASLQALLFAILPFLLHAVGISGDVYNSRQIPASEFRLFERVAQFAIPIIGGGVIVALALNVVGTFERSFAPYLGGLVFALVLSSVMFVRLLTGSGPPKTG